MGRRDSRAFFIGEKDLIINKSVGGFRSKDNLLRVNAAHSPVIV
jgi:hypothetical protein